MPVKNATNLINALSDEMEVRLQQLRDAGPALDKHYTDDVKTRWQEVIRVGFSRDFQVNHPVSYGVTAAVRWTGTPQGNAPVQALTHTVIPKAQLAYPGTKELVLPGTLNMVVKLARALGNLMIPVEYLKADPMDASIAPIFETLLRKAAKNILLAEIQSYYRQDLGSAAGEALGICTVGSATPTRTTEDGVANAGIEFVIGKGASLLFHEGSMYQALIPATGVTRTANPLVCEKVRRMPDTATDTTGYGTVKLVSNPAESLLSIVQNDVIARYEGLAAGADSTNPGPKGPEDWLVTSGTDVFGFNITSDNPELQSIVSAINGPITRTVFMRLIGRYIRALGPEDVPDTWIMSPGALVAAVDNLEGLRRFNLGAGESFTFAEGFKVGSTPFEFDGLPMQLRVSAYMPSRSNAADANPQGGRVWGLKTREGNLKRYVPPTQKFSTPGKGPIPNEIEFLNSGGNQGIFNVKKNSDGDSIALYEAPFDRWLAIAPTIIPGVLATDVSELL